MNDRHDYFSNRASKMRSIDNVILSGDIILATTEEQLRWALTQPVPFVAVSQ